MANPLSHNAFTSRQAVDPQLRKVARLLPRGNALQRGYQVQRAIMTAMGNAGRIRNLPTAEVNEHVSVRLHRPPGLPERAPAMLWIQSSSPVSAFTCVKPSPCARPDPGRQPIEGTESCAFRLQSVQTVQL